jgi:phage-related protein
MFWKIDYYETSSGRIPVQELIDKLAEKSQAKVYNTLEFLAEFGPRLGLPHTKKIKSTPLWELRILGEKSLRFFYIARVGKSFLLLHGFAKKQQKTPKKEIKTALKRLRDYENRN